MSANLRRDDPRELQSLVLGVGTREVIHPVLGKHFPQSTRSFFPHQKPHPQITHSHINKNNKNYFYGSFSHVV